jgi:hypothetical protein
MTHKTKSHCEWPGGNSGSVVCETGVAVGRGNYSTRLAAPAFDFYGCPPEGIGTVVVPLQRNLSLTGHGTLVTARNFEKEINAGLMQYAQNGFKPCQLNGKRADKTNGLKINIFFDPNNGVVGTKFVNFFSGKYCIPDFQYTRSDSFQGSFCDGVLANFNVTARNVLVEAN